jgi:Flp pilus assembly protein TadD/RNA polymerase subunit RPABC4/transcription elongation factor Spt4
MSRVASKFRCPMCSALVKADSNQCPICLTSFKDAPKKKKRKDVGLCSHCGAFLLGDKTKCPVCSQVQERDEDEPSPFAVSASHVHGKRVVPEEDEIPSIHLCPSCRALIKMGVQQCPICNADLSRDTVISIGSTSLDDEIAPARTRVSPSDRGRDEYFRTKAEVTKAFDPDKVVDIKDVEELRFEEEGIAITDDVAFMDRILLFTGGILGITLLFMTISFAFPQIQGARAGGYLMLTAVPIILFVTLLAFIQLSATLKSKVLILAGTITMTISHFYFAVDFLQPSKDQAVEIAIIAQFAAGLALTLIGVRRLSKKDERNFPLWTAAVITISHGIGQVIIWSSYWYAAQAFTVIGIALAYFVLNDYFTKKFIASLPTPSAISKDASPLVFEGIAMLLSGDASQALTDINNEIAFNPDNEMLWNTKGYALTRMGRYQEAVKCYDRAIAVNPAYAEAWNNKGNALTRQRRYDEALWCYDKALEIDPNYKEVWLNKRYVYMRMGRRNDAQRCERRAVDY